MSNLFRSILAQDCIVQENELMVHHDGAIMQTCQPSRIFRDCPGIQPLVPESRRSDHLSRILSNSNDDLWPFNKKKLFTKIFCTYSQMEGTSQLRWSLTVTVFESQFSAISDSPTSSSVALVAVLSDSVSGGSLWVLQWPLCSKVKERQEVEGGMEMVQEQEGAL